MSPETSGKIDLTVSNVAASFYPGVLAIGWEFREDWSGEECIYLRVVFSDLLDRMGQINTARAVSDAFIGRLESGLRTYFNYRTKAECLKFRDPEWAFALAV
jgi:hypothetical protein